MSGDDLLGDITFSSATEDGPAEDVDSDGGQWCSSGASDLTPYIQLNFTQTVSLTYMVARGRADGAFVSEFRLEVQNGSKQFQPYNIVTDESIVSEFIFLLLLSYNAHVLYTQKEFHWS